MWLLSVRRAHSHEMYDLLKPPLVAFIMMLIFVVVMAVTNTPLEVTISSPSVQISQYGTSRQMVMTSLAMVFMGGMGFSFLGVAIAEGASRLRRKWKLRR